jgi:hypothetical protein
MKVKLLEGLLQEITLLTIKKIWHLVTLIQIWNLICSSASLWKLKWKKPSMKAVLKCNLYTIQKIGFLKAKLTHW